MTTDKTIEVEAGTLEEARKEAESQIPAGYILLSEQVVSDGNPTRKVVQSIEIEADSVDDAWKQIKPRIPPKLEVISERIILDGKTITVKEEADTIEGAYAKAQSRIPPNAEISERKVLSDPKQITLMVEAFNDRDAASNARFNARMQFGNNATVKDIRLVVAGNAGFLRIGRKPNHYEAKVILPIPVEIVYKTKAKVMFDIGSIDKSKAKISLKIRSEEEATQDFWNWFETYINKSVKKCIYCNSNWNIAIVRCDRFQEIRCGEESLDNTPTIKLQCLRLGCGNTKYDDLSPEAWQAFAAIFPVVNKEEVCFKFQS